MKHGTLRNEIGKRGPFDSPEEEALLNIFRTNDRLAIDIDRLLRAFDLTQSQYNVLRILRGEGKPLSCAQIGSRTITIVPALTGLIDRLEAAGLILRERSAEDRRVIYIAITEKALGLLAKVDPPLKDLHRRLLGHLSGVELTQLSHLLEKIRQPQGDETRG